MTMNEFLEVTRWMSEVEYHDFVDCASKGLIDEEELKMRRGEENDKQRMVDDIIYS